jgi:4-amino-4-deoxy-L-arabinose transferase-like glycosyltransferase
MNKYAPQPLVITLILILLVPSLFYNLGLVGISADEPTRANVAMEMMYSGNYLVSTIAGEYYYKKPPLFNWLLVVLYSVTGNKSEYVTRLTAVIPLLLFSLRIFFISRRHVNKSVALLTAFLFITFGRMLYYDSMLGHIDILYAWVTFESFYLLYARFDSNSRFFMFLGFYALNAIGFMLKGLPSLLFPVFTLLAMAIHRRQLKWIFSWQHVLAAVIAFLPVGLFFYAYSLQNSITGWIEQLWDQSKQRTVLDKTWWESIRHLFLFPIDHIMHLAPWSLLIIFIFRNRFTRSVKQNRFLIYFLQLLLLNLIPYWASPGYYPRYLFMLYPIVFMFLAEAFWQSYTVNVKDFRYTNILTRVLMLIVSVAFVAVAIYLRIAAWSVYFYIILALLVLCLVLVFYKPAQTIWIFVAFLLVTRIAFNFYVLPHRKTTGKTDLYKTAALGLARISENQPLFIIPGTPLDHNYIYYLERERKQPILFKQPDTNSLFIFNPGNTTNKPFKTIRTFPIDYNNMTLHIGRVEKQP